MDTQLLEAVDKALEKRFSGVDTALTSLNETARALLPKPGEQKVESNPVDTAIAEMQERSGILDKAMSVKVWEIPIGEAAIGGFVAIFASELVDGFLKTQTTTIKGLVKLGAAGATVLFGKRLLGSTGSKIVALLLTFDAIRDLTPLDQWAYDLASKITGILPSAGLASNQTVNRAQMDAVNRQANQVASSLLSQLGGR